MRKLIPQYLLALFFRPTCPPLYSSGFIQVWKHFPAGRILAVLRLIRQIGNDRLVESQENDILDYSTVTSKVRFLISIVYEKYTSFQIYCLWAIRNA